MISQRNDREPGTNLGQGRAGMNDGAREGTQGREGDPRNHESQDRRTAGARREDGRAKDDPSRAPESGTP